MMQPALHGIGQDAAVQEELVLSHLFIYMDSFGFPAT